MRVRPGQQVAVGIGAAVVDQAAQVIHVFDLGVPRVLAQKPVRVGQRTIRCIGLVVGVDQFELGLGRVLRKWKAQQNGAVLADGAVIVGRIQRTAGHPVDLISLQA